MPELSWPGILVGTAVAFVIGGGYYALVGDRLASVRPAPEAAAPGWWAVPAEVARCLVLAAVVVGVAGAADAGTWQAGLLLGLVLWIGFPLVLWTGAVVHERTPVRLAVIHGGDWLLKLLALGVTAGLLS